MKSVEEAIKSRYSCRSYLSKPVDKEIIEQLIDVARFAPSAVNYQPWSITVITQPENLQKVHQCYPREWFKAAPVVLMFCTNRDQAWRRADGKQHGDIDIAIIVDHLTLLATEKGLCTCWVCNFDAAKLSLLFNLPDHQEPAILLPLGYPAINEKPIKKRKELKDIVEWK